MKTFYLFVGILLFLVMQAAIAGRIAIGNVAPDFVILMVVFFSLYRRSVQGALFGFVVGFLQDLGNPAFLGLNALVKSILGFMVGQVASKTFSESVPILYALFFVSALGHDLVYVLVFYWPRLGSAFATFFSQSLPSAAYSALFGVTIDRLASRLGRRVVTAIGKEGQH